MMQRFVNVFLATAILATLTAGVAWPPTRVPGWYLDAELAWWPPVVTRNPARWALAPSCADCGPSPS